MDIELRTEFSIIWRLIRCRHAASRALDVEILLSHADYILRQAS